MRRVASRSLAGIALVTVALAGCTPSPAASPTESATASPTPAAPTPTPTATSSSNAGVDCLVAGSPWTLANDEIAQQIPDVLSGIPVTDADVSGEQTLTVDADLAATMSTDLTLTIAADLGDGLSMRIVQVQTGDAAGTWVLADDGLLRAEEAWTSDFDATTTVYVEDVEAPETVPLPAPDIAASTTTEFDCDGDALTLRTIGSPFALPFRS